MLRRLLAAVLCLILLSGCVENSEDGSSRQTVSAKTEILALTDGLDEYSKSLITAEFVDFLHSEFGDGVVLRLRDALLSGDFSKDSWHAITGNTAAVLSDMYSGALDENSPNYRSDIKVIDAGSDGAVIRIVGDICFADNWRIAPQIGENGIYDVMSENTVELLRSADVFLANNEFTYSTRGEPLKNKYYTFRAHPDRVQHMLEIGADIVSLANNHAYDYGEDAFADTLATLKNAGLPYIGGGENAEEAAKPYYFIVGGRKYAFSAATRAEKYILTPEAKENSSGVMRTYDPEKYLEVIRSAEEQCDYNIVYVHWGTEGSHEIEDKLYRLGCQYIDAGADIVVGAHAHVLQGIQFYSGVPIVYNLGNFLFNAKTMDTGILEVGISDGGSCTYRFIPAIQKNCYVQTVDGTEKERILKFMEDISVDVTFDTEGYFVER